MVLCRIIYSVWGTLKENFLYYEPGTAFSSGCTCDSKLAIFCSERMFYFFHSCGLVFALYFSNSDLHNLKTFHIKTNRLLYAADPDADSISVYTDTLQSEFHRFCLTVAAYNWIYGHDYHCHLAKTIWAKRLTENYHQYVLVASSLLIPIWALAHYGVPFHALGLRASLKSLGNSISWIVAIVLVFILYHAFHEGIWGWRLRREKK